MKSNKSVLRTKFFFTKFHFLQFQKWPKINFRTGKKFKTTKNAMSRNLFLNYLISRVFWAGLFKIFWPAVAMFKKSMSFLLKLHCNSKLNIKGVFSEKSFLKDKWKSYPMNNVYTMFTQFLLLFFILISSFLEGDLGFGGLDLGAYRVLDSSFFGTYNGFRKI